MMTIETLEFYKSLRDNHFRDCAIQSGLVDANRTALPFLNLLQVKVMTEGFPSDYELPIRSQLTNDQVREALSEFTYLEILDLYLNSYRRFKHRSRVKKFQDDFKKMQPDVVKYELLQVASTTHDSSRDYFNAFQDKLWDDYEARWFTVSELGTYFGLVNSSSRSAACRCDNTSRLTYKGHYLLRCTSQAEDLLEGEDSSTSFYRPCSLSEKVWDLYHSQNKTVEEISAMLVEPQNFVTLIVESETPPDVLNPFNLAVSKGVVNVEAVLEKGFKACGRVLGRSYEDSSVVSDSSSEEAEGLPETHSYCVEDVSNLEASVVDEARDKVLAVMNYTHALRLPLDRSVLKEISKVETTESWIELIQSLPEQYQARLLF